MKHLFYTILILIGPNLLMAQYIETFNTSNKGILSGTCSSNDPTSCASIDFTGVDWTIGGDLSGIDIEGIFTQSGSFGGSDIDESACWISPTLDISNAGSVDLIVTFRVEGGWDSGSAPGSIDAANVMYSVDGGAFTTIANANGCPASPATISGNECSGISGTMTFTPSASGISGNTLDIMICIDVNSSGESGWIEEVSVPQANVILLPVELISFKGEQKNNVVTLEWTTATELNNDKFEIEESNNGRNFQKIGEVMGKGTTIERQNYFFEIKNPSDGVSYYRLKQKDFNGQFDFSKIINVNYIGAIKEVGMFYPNPSNSGNVKLNYASKSEEHIYIELFDISGKLVSRQSYNITQGNNTLNLNFSKLEEGIFIAKIGNERKETLRKLVIKQ